MKDTHTNRITEQIFRAEPSVLLNVDFAPSCYDKPGHRVFWMISERLRRNVLISHMVTEQMNEELKDCE